MLAYRFCFPHTDHVIFPTELSLCVSTFMYTYVYVGGNFHRQNYLEAVCVGKSKCIFSEEIYVTSLPFSQLDPKNPAAH